MKYILCLVIACTIVHSKSIAQTPSAHFKFDNSLVEFYSDSLLDSTNAYFSFDSDENGASNTALKMDDGVFIMPDPAFTQFGLGDFSLSIWFKRTASLWPTEWIFQKSSADGYLKLRYNGFFDQMGFYFRPDTDSSELIVGSPSNSVGQNTWSLFTITVDRDGDMKMYQNGQFVSGIDISHVSSSPADFLGGNFRLGCQSIVINDLLFFESALDSTEVQVLYNHELNIDDLSQDDFVIYPNPVVKTLKIKSKKTINERYSIYSISGELVQKGMIENSEIEIGELSSGKYLLRILDRSFTIII